ncbi:MAG TPA: pilus (MSHA type) biogenesis protein MshL [Rhodocyclaceae bacterium]|nr:pilus (MSHA type) biogenesis protein MshL [Rhodocyclaceae bacterium]
MKRTNMGWAAGAALVAGLVASACTTPPARDATRERIAEELKQATESRQPGQRPAAVDRALLAPPALSAAEPRKPEPRFDLSVSNAPAGQVFLAIVSGTPYSMLLPPDISGNLSVTLKNVTVREALDTIRELYGYEYRIQGSRIFIQSNTVQTRFFQINYLASKRAGASSTRVMSGSVSGTQSGTTSGTGTTTATTSAQNTSLESTSIVTGSLNDFWLELHESVATLLGCEFRVVSSSAATTASATGTVSSASGSAGQINMGGNPIGSIIALRGLARCPEGRSVLVNQPSGMVVVKAYPAELREVDRFLKTMQVSVERQVMLEAKIIEVQLNDNFQSGVNWAAFDSYGGHRWSNNAQGANIVVPGGQPYTITTVDATTGIVTQRIPTTITGDRGILNPLAGLAAGGVMGLAFQTGSFMALLSFLETQGQVHVLSSPRIATLNNQKAVLKVGTDEYFITNVTPSSSATTSTSGTSTTATSVPTITTQPFFSGIALDVTPQIDDGESIILHVRPSVSSVAEKRKTIDLGQQGIYVLPLASSNINETDSIVRVQDGNIVAIGGLMSQSQSQDGSGLPAARDIPVLGSLFGQKARTFVKRELVILLKPTVIRGDKEWEAGLRDVQGRLENFAPRRAEPEKAETAR